MPLTKEIIIRTMNPVNIDPEARIVLSMLLTYLLTNIWYVASRNAASNANMAQIILEKLTLFFNKLSNQFYDVVSGVFDWYVFAFLFFL